MKVSVTVSLQFSLDCPVGTPDRTTTYDFLNNLIFLTTQGKENSIKRPSWMHKVQAGQDLFSLAYACYDISYTFSGYYLCHL